MGLLGHAYRLRRPITGLVAATIQSYGPAHTTTAMAKQFSTLPIKGHPLDSITHSFASRQQYIAPRSLLIVFAVHRDTSRRTSAKTFYMVIGVHSGRSNAPSRH